jgi:hypothetical protein
VQPYLRFLLGFLGITDVTFVTVENTTGDPDSLAREIRKAEDQIAGLFRVARAPSPTPARTGILAALSTWFARLKAA